MMIAPGPAGGPEHRAERRAPGPVVFLATRISTSAWLLRPPDRTRYVKVIML
jgi:hypothetical protein